MATLKLNEKTIEIKDGEEVKEFARELGVPFGCENGFCGTCEVDVILGQENLSALSERETEMDLNKNRRRMCQCSIKNGNVEIKC